MYCYKVKRSNSYLFVIFAVLLCVGVFLCSWFLFSNDTKEEYEITKISQNENSVIINNRDKYEAIENTMKCVVGISSIKVEGNSIFNFGTEKEWGMGTRFFGIFKWIYSNKSTCSRY